MFQEYLRKEWVRNLLIVLAFVVGVVMIFTMREVFGPIFLAVAIGYVGNPLLIAMEKRRISRTWGILILGAGLLLVFTGFCLYIIPRMITQIQDLGKALPVYVEKLEGRFLPLIQDYISTHPDELEQVRQSFIAWLQTNAGEILRRISIGLSTSFRSVTGLISNLLGLLVIPVLAFYSLRDFEVFKLKLQGLIPPKRRDYLMKLGKDLDQALGNFIKGQLLVALILSVIYSIGLTIAGCPGALVIGFLAGLANLVPYLGLAVGLVPAVLLTYLSGNPLWQVLFSGLTFGIGQALEGMLITPKVVGESLGLHPAVVLIALLIGGSYFGFMGMILALPSCAVLMVLLHRAYRSYMTSPFYFEDDESLPKPLPTKKKK